jgi:hypothetical protein
MGENRERRGLFFFFFFYSPTELLLLLNSDSLWFLRSARTKQKGLRLAETWALNLNIVTGLFKKNKSVRCSSDSALPFWSINWQKGRGEKREKQRDKMEPLLLDFDFHSATDAGP